MWKVEHIPAQDLEAAVLRVVQDPSLGNVGGGTKSQTHEPPPRLAEPCPLPQVHSPSDQNDLAHCIVLLEWLASLSCLSIGCGQRRPMQLGFGFTLAWSVTQLLIWPHSFRSQAGLCHLVSSSIRIGGKALQSGFQLAVVVWAAV